MSYENSIVCPECKKVNPVQCGNAYCPFEDLFWEEDE
jgi:hypothetical protein